MSRAFTASPSRRRALALITAGAFSLALPSVAHADKQSLYRLGGNNFILRERSGNGHPYITVYRQAGDQWEKFGHGVPAPDGSYGGLVGRIRRQGSYVGPSHVDLDDWMNTDLNRSSPEPWQ
jgi:hypothetical protein